MRSYYLNFKLELKNSNYTCFNTQFEKKTHQEFTHRVFQVKHRLNSKYQMSERIMVNI